MERLCTSPTYGMWYPADKQSVASNLPPMVVFPNFSKFYEDWKEDLIRRGVNLRLSTECTRVLKRGKAGVVVEIKADQASTNSGPQAPHLEEKYDEIVICVL